jgi:hypothetical protein
MVSLLNNTEVTVTKAVRAETKDKPQAHIETVQLDIKAPLKANVELQDTKTEEIRSDMNTYVDRFDTMIAPIQAAIIPLQADMYKTDNRVSEMTQGQLSLEKTQTAMSEKIHDIQHSVGSLQPCRVPRCSIRCKMLLTDHSTSSTTSPGYNVGTATPPVTSPVPVAVIPSHPCHHCRSTNVSSEKLRQLRPARLSQKATHRAVAASAGSG